MMILMIWLHLLMVCRIGVKAMVQKVSNVLYHSVATEVEGC